ncbi:MAG TPA: DUF1800 family protein [Verrucomicrobiae bacterium]|nr:DUF1800 family protein [Verrucomicrobiae bacterium]
MNFSRRHFLKVGGGTAALLATVGCDQLPRELTVLYAQQKPVGPFQPPLTEQIDPITHALNRVAFGPRPGDYERVAKLASAPEPAAAAYIEEQLNPERIEDESGALAVRRFETLRLPLGELFEYQDELLHNELMRGTLARAVFSDRQLYEVMVQFWSDHFNIDPSKGDCKWLTVADDREVIRKHALGRFPDMLRASALSPAMLWYLDGRVNRRANMSEKPNENYARELLELHTLGVHGGYTQKDVMEVARCLTGWTVRSTNQKPYLEIGKVEFKPHLHDGEAKEVLGHRVPALPARASKEERERLGREELDRVLAIVMKHPSTARHISTKLCQRFIADEPPASAVETVAGTFARTNGDIRETLRTLFGTEEFRQQRGNKFKRPFNFIASALRATGASTDSGVEIIGYLRRMGHAPFSYPTPDGFPEPAGPWMGTLLWRWNFALAISENRIKGTKVDFPTLHASSGGDPGLMAHLLGRKAMKEEVEAYDESGAGLALLLASPAFQRC